MLIERPDAHRPHGALDQLADRVIDHGADDAGLEAEAVGEVGGAVELAAADVDLALARLAEGNHAAVEAMHQGAERNEVQGRVGRNRKSCNGGSHR